ncbi:hypothetical protein [Lucifera butyrica]|uniref:hypothetical protein n=1 Tax=Lucifera butyrica TaxID=1351585 RepID=UPI000F037F2D|nr:hypothetical protein [Lucifera butyrica]
MHKTGKLVCMLCLVAASLVLSMHPGFSSPRINTSDLSQESLWISLDLPAEKREKVDGIINDEYKQVKILQKNMLITDLSNFNTLYRLTNYMKKMSDIRTTTNNRILSILSPEQQFAFENLLATKQQANEKTTATMLALNLTSKQQIIIVNLMLQSQKNVWATIADTSLSWEKRTKKLHTNIFSKISAFLTKDQRIMMNTWLQYDDGTIGN